MSKFLWGAYPYICMTLFFVVPVLRMVFQPFTWSTRASGLFGRSLLGPASLLLHWGLLAVLLGHLAGLFGGLTGSTLLVGFFYWVALIGGLMVLAGAVIALVRRFVVPEVRAMSQTDDFVIHLFLVTIVALALYQVIAHQVFGVAFTAASWFASLWSLSPQPELMASAPLLSKLHVFLALTFFAYFPFTKLVHFWTYPVSYATRAYQSMRTPRFRSRRRWDLGLQTDKSFLVYGLGALALCFLLAGLLLGRVAPATEASAAIQHEAALPAIASANGQLAGVALYVSQCARCHGVAGRGDGPGAGSALFAQPPRDLTADLCRFVSTENGIPSGQDHSHVIRHGLPQAGMPAFDELSEAQVASLVTVLRGMSQPLRAAPEPRPYALPPRPPTTAQTIAGGEKLFKANCVMCHGDHGRGDGPVAPSIRDTHDRPVPPADLAAGAVKAGRSPEQLFMRISAGIPGGQGGSYLMMPFGKGLSPEQRWAIVDYLETHVLPRER